jgi:hypothetical protein
MRFFKPRRPIGAALKIIAVLAVLALVGSCATVRKVTYPPDFVYLEKQEISSSMRRMAVSVNKLDRLLSDTEDQSESKKENVLLELNNIESITRKLRSGSIQSNHPLIDQNMDNFRDQLLMAKSAIGQDPPNYYPAGRLVGQCHGCHIQR